MKQQYLIRLDDACPTMDRAKWRRIEDILDHYGVKPMVGVIPHNEDPNQMINSVDSNFWNQVHFWGEKGWAIALHGYNHCYSSDGGMKGLNPMWERSEFAGLSLYEQQEKIRCGIEIFQEHGVVPKYFFAPSHTFDENTLDALFKESAIRIISDTIATKPYKYKDFVFIPQFSGQCRKIKIHGTFTFCLHPNNMKEEDFIQTESFIQRYNYQFVSFNEIDISDLGEKDWFSRILSWVYFRRRMIKGIK